MVPGQELVQTLETNLAALPLGRDEPSACGFDPMVLRLTLDGLWFPPDGWFLRIYSVYESMVCHGLSYLALFVGIQRLRVFSFK